MDFEFSVLNFKSIASRKLLKLKPITIFCGVNSIGKSSILQSQLLLSQSFTRQFIETGKSGIKIPQFFIFEGDKCHLQNYKNVIFENDIDNKLEFDWDYTLKEKKIILKIVCSFIPQSSVFAKGFPIVESIDINISENGVINKLELYLMKDNYQFYKLKLTNIRNLLKKISNDKDYFPYIYYGDDLINDKFESITQWVRHNEKDVRLSDINKPELNEFKDEISIDNVYVRFNSIFPIEIRINKTGLDKFINVENIQRIYSKKKRKYEEDFQDMMLDRARFYLIEGFKNYIRKIIQPLIHYYMRLKYLGPLREEPKRYYLFSDLRLLDIGLKGENTTQVLTIKQRDTIKFINIKRKDDSFKFTKTSKTLLSGVNEWLKTMNLQQLKPTTTMELITKMLVNYSDKQPKDSSVSLPDIGFGVSQVLPVLVEVLRMEKNETIILEQPEIHLHPRLQGDLADFILCNSRLGKKFIIETHSEYFLKRLCLRIAQFKDQDLSKMISMFFVVKNSDGRGSKIIDVEIDEFGRIIKWPKGFLDENEDALILKASVRKQRYKNEN